MAAEKSSQSSLLTALAAAILEEASSSSKFHSSTDHGSNDPGIHPKAAEILGRAAAGESLSEMEIGELRGHLLAGMHNSSNPAAFVKKYLDALRGHPSCENVAAGLGIDVDKYYIGQKSQQPKAGNQSGASAFNSSDTSDLDDAYFGGLGSRPKNIIHGREREEAVRAGDKRKSLFDFTEGPSTGAPIAKMSSYGYGFASEEPRHHSANIDPWEEMGAVDGWEASHEIQHYGETVDTGGYQDYNMGFPTARPGPGAFGGPYGVPPPQFARPPFRPAMGTHFGVRPPFGMPSNIRPGRPGEGPSGWMSGIVDPARRHLFDLTTIHEKYLNMPVYRAIRRVNHVGGDAAHWEDVKSVRDCLTRLINHNMNPFPVVAMYGTFLPESIMERILTTGEMKRKLQSAAVMVGVTPDEAKLCVTGRMPQMLPKILRAPWEEVKRAVHKDRPDKVMPKDKRLDDPSKYNPQDIPGVKILRDGTVSSELTKRTRNWIQAILYMLASDGRWPHDEYMQMLKNQFGVEAIDRFMENDRSIKMIQNGTEKRLKNLAND